MVLIISLLALAFIAGQALILVWAARLRNDADKAEKRADASAQRLSIELDRYHRLLRLTSARLHGTEPANLTPQPLNLNLTTEFAALLMFTADVAKALRMNSPRGGEHYFDNPHSGLDVMWLADCLHNFDRFYNPVHESYENLVFACDDLLSDFEFYQSGKTAGKRLGCPKDSFDRNAQFFDLDTGKAAIEAIKAKAQLLLDNQQLGAPPLSDEAIAIASSSIAARAA